jgi:hypothetical protein
MVSSAKTSSDLKALPIACTLDARDLKERLASIRELARDALLGFEREGLVLSLRYDAGSADRVRKMVQGEERCCAFLRFDVEEDGGSIMVTVTAPEAARDAAGELFAQFTTSAEMPTP